jgi:hypothetical protein
MKTVGFLNVHEKSILGNVIGYDVNHPLDIDEMDRKKILQYLSAGTYIFGMTLSLQDSEKNIIGPYEIYTDGQWLWPKYYSYYISKKIINSIPEEFFIAMKGRDFMLSPLNMDRKQEAENFFMNLLLENNPKFAQKMKYK